MKEEDDFLSQHPEFTDAMLRQEYMAIPTAEGLNEAWLKYLIEYHLSFLPEDEKKDIFLLLKPLVDLGARSNILRREINMYLDEYDIIWDKYLMYMRRGKYDPRLIVQQEAIRTAFELQLNRSVEMRQMELIFTRKFELLRRQIGRTFRRLRERLTTKSEET